MILVRVFLDGIIAILICTVCTMMFLKQQNRPRDTFLRTNLVSKQCSTARVGLPSWGSVGAEVTASATFPRLSSQDHDFEPLRPGEPIFKLFSGEDVLYEGDSVVYPVFVNEAAYYEKHVAFLKSEKIRISVPALPGLTPSSTQTP